MPALLAKMPIGPRRVSTASTNAIVSDASETSARMASALLDQLRGGACGRLVAVDDRDRGAHLRQPERNRTPDIAPAACDQRDWRPVSAAHDFRNSQPPSARGRQASAGAMVLTSL